MTNYIEYATRPTYVANPHRSERGFCGCGCGRTLADLFDAGELATGDDGHPICRDGKAEGDRIIAEELAYEAAQRGEDR